MKKHRQKTVRLIRAVFLLIFFIAFGKGYSQVTPNSVGIGTTNPNPSAILHLESNKQGFLMPRINTAQVYTITAPTVGLIVFNTDDECYWYKRTNYWARLCNTDSLNSTYINNLHADSILANYISTNILNADTIIANYVSTNLLYADSIITNYINFGSAYGDSIFVHYLQADTAVINNLTVNIVQGDTAIFNYGNFNVLNTDTLISNYINTNTLHADSLYLGNTPIQTVISDSIAAQAWLLKGNSGTTPVINFLGTKDPEDLVFRTNNIERSRILSSGQVGINTPAPTTALDVNGQIRLRTGATNLFLLQSDAQGVGSWVNPATLFTSGPTGSLNGSAWTTLGNAGTNPATNFVGTTDAQDFVVRTANIERFRINQNKQLLGLVSNSNTENPQYSFTANPTTGLYYYTRGAAKFHLALRKEGLDLISNDTLGNTHIMFTRFAPASEIPYVMTGGSRLNVVFGNSQFTSNSLENFCVGSNSLTAGQNNVCFNGYSSAGNANIVPGTGCFVWGTNNFVYGVGNTFVAGTSCTVSANAAAGIAMGYHNSYNPPLVPATGENFGVVIGTGNFVAHKGSVSIGCNSANNATTSFAQNGISLIGYGGTRIYSNGILSSGVTLAPGGGAWAAISDRNMKENIKKVDNNEILNKVMAIEVSEWTYIAQQVDSMNKYSPANIHYDKAPVHIGPMAQDFAEAFTYGEYKDKITSSDMDGVLFAALQALAIDNKKMREELARMKEEIAASKSFTPEDLKPQLEKAQQEIEELKKLVNDYIKSH